MVAGGGGWGAIPGPTSRNETLATAVFCILHCINSMFSFLCLFSCSLCSYTPVFYIPHCILCSLRLCLQSPALCVAFPIFCILCSLILCLFYCLYVQLLPFSVFSTACILCSLFFVYSPALCVALPMHFLHSMFFSSLSVILLYVYSYPHFSVFFTVFYNYVLFFFVYILLFSVQLLPFVYSMFSSFLSIFLPYVQLCSHILYSLLYSIC